MLEFITVDPAPVFPQACVCCAGTIGQMIDTHRELHPYGRVYVCTACIKRAAVVVGLLDGDEADAIAEQIERLASVERDLAASNRDREKLSAANTELERKVEELADTAEQRQGRIVQLEERLGERAEADLQLVAPAAAAPAKKGWFG